MEKRYNWMARLGLLAAVGAVLMLWIMMDWPCPVRALFGLPCAACGMSRAWLAALRLDLAGAFGYHPMFWSVPVLALLFVCSEKPSRWRTGLCVLIVLGFLGCYMIRLGNHFIGFARI